METGFLLDRGPGAFLPVRWIASEPELSWIGSVKLKDKDEFQVEAWRCKSCGSLDFYALKPREA
jgi:hypothetical protein